MLTFNKKKKSLEQQTGSVSQKLSPAHVKEMGREESKASIGSKKDSDSLTIPSGIN